jgi:hypothetical protein
MTSILIYQKAGYVFHVHLQGVKKSLNGFAIAVSKESLGLQERHGCQKMRLILKFTLKM